MEERKREPGGVLSYEADHSGSTKQSDDCVSQPENDATKKRLQKMRKELFEQSVSVLSVGSRSTHFHYLDSEYNWGS